MKQDQRLIQLTARLESAKELLKSAEARDDFEQVVAVIRTVLDELLAEVSWALQAAKLPKN